MNKRNKKVGGIGYTSDIPILKGKAALNKQKRKALISETKNNKAYLTGQLEYIKKYFAENKPHLSDEEIKYSENVISDLESKINKL